MTQAWPVHPIVNAGMNVTPFHVASSDPRTSRALRAQAGNSMNLFMLAVQFIHTLCHIQVPDQLLQSSLVKWDDRFGKSCLFSR